VVDCCPYVTPGIKIYVSPGFKDYDPCVILDKSHPDYVNLYNRIKVGQSYNFEVVEKGFGQHLRLSKIHPLEIKKLVITVVGIVNLEIEGIRGYQEIITDDQSSKIRLLTKRSDILPITYNIEYRKFMGNQYYEVISLSKII
jgi:hypothetical protein